MFFKAIRHIFTTFARKFSNQMKKSSLFFALACLLTCACNKGEEQKAEQTNYFAHQAWRTRRYFDGREWEDDQTIQPKQIRELTRTEHAVYFYRIGKDQIPANNDELMKQYAVFITQPDPAPITDDNGNIVTLTEEEQARWRSYLDSRQRKRVAGGSAVPTAATATDGSPSAPPQEEDLPF